MMARRVWISFAAVALTFGTAACSGGHGSGTAKSLPPPVSAARTTGSPAKPSAADIARENAMIQGILAQLQQATTTKSGGSQALTKAQAQKIVDAENKALGVK